MEGLEITLVHLADSACWCADALMDSAWMYKVMQIPQL
jgi:hypothetical protein